MTFDAAFVENARDVLRVGNVGWCCSQCYGGTEHKSSKCRSPHERASLPSYDLYDFFYAKANRQAVQAVAIASAFQPEPRTGLTVSARCGRSVRWRMPGTKLANGSV